MKYELKINGNILKTDDKDVALEFIKAMGKQAEHYVPHIPFVAPIVIERREEYWPYRPGDVCSGTGDPPFDIWDSGNTGTAIIGFSEPIQSAYS